MIVRCCDEAMLSEEIQKATDKCQRAQIQAEKMTLLAETEGSVDIEVFESKEGRAGSARLITTTVNVGGVALKDAGE